MQHTEQWIWLSESDNVSYQHNVFSAFEPGEAASYIVAEFMKEYSFCHRISAVSLRFSGDNAFQLYCNEELIATGPACVGGDFIGNETCRENFYSFETTIHPESSNLNFFAKVRMLPEQICDYSKGHGGFMLSGIVELEDGSKHHVFTDESWLVRENKAYTAPCSFDGRIESGCFVNARVIKNIWNTETAPIPVRSEKEHFVRNSIITLNPLEEKTVVLEFEKIMSGFVKVTSNSQGDASVKIVCRELFEDGSSENVVIRSSDAYRGFHMHSAGNLLVTAKNHASSSAEITVSFIETHYPVAEECRTLTSDDELNSVLETCKHTLKICRQTHHLDSPRHCEPMACTGDYYIESLMTPFAFGDMRLAEFDLVRTARMLERENGRMFHTTYSLIWVRMLYDTFMATGNVDLLKACRKGLDLLLSRFETYIGDSGLIENPPDYMFIDWIYIDDISMHHPPKALGQTCLNMFYFGALSFAGKIYDFLGCKASAEKCVTKSECVREAINTRLFDKEKGVYFMGLNTPEDASPDWEWMPGNVSKRYYLKHANVLAAYFGVCDDETAKSLIHKIMRNEIEGDCQPYFLHYLLEAVFRTGLRDKYTLEILEKWKPSVKDCPKGLVEGFIAPEPTYSFDHSHAWGGTPLYSLPKALFGLEILSPGMKAVRFSPSLLGLSEATAEMLTPYGKIVCKQEKGHSPEIKYPKEIEIR